MWKIWHDCHECVNFRQRHCSMTTMICFEYWLTENWYIIIWNRYCSPGTIVSAILVRNSVIFKAIRDRLLDKSNQINETFRQNITHHVSKTFGKQFFVHHQLDPNVPSSSPSNLPFQLHPNHFWKLGWWFLTDLIIITISSYWLVMLLLAYNLASRIVRWYDYILFYLR